MIYCVVPIELADELHERLREHFAHDRRIEVVVDHRERDRRGSGERRVSVREIAKERRARSRRRTAERRRSAVHQPSPELPSLARKHRRRIKFVRLSNIDGLHAEGVASARLVRRAQAGDARAFDTLYLRYYDRVYVQLASLLADRHEAEDATQDVFAKAHSALANYEQRGVPFHSWLFTIARNVAFDRLRKRRAVPADPHQMLSQRERAEDPAAPHVTPHDLYDRAVLHIAERLPAAQRQVLYLRYSFDWTQQETARFLAKSPDAVRKLETRAIARLRDELPPPPAESRRQRMPMLRALQPLPILRRRRFALAFDPQRHHRR